MNNSTALRTSTDASLLERVRRLEFAGQNEAALALLDAEAKLSPRLEAIRGTLLIFTGDRLRARIALTNALARGYRPALAALSSLQRLEGESRDALLELSECDLEACDDFERANLEREVGLLHEERDALDEARIWLERAWRSALLGTFGQYQLAGIAQALGRVLGRLGYDALAISVFDEGLRHARADRRVPLLYERTLRHINLGLLEAASDDLEELRVFVPNEPELGLLTRYAEARLQHALGDARSARTNFELALYFAALHTSPVAREVTVYALLWLVRLDTDTGTLERVPARLEQAAGFVRTDFERAWLALRRARFVSSLGDHSEAAELLHELPDLFLALGSRREAGIARLHRAEALMKAGADRLEEADFELRRAADLAHDLGGAGVFHNELMALRDVQWHLEVTQGWADGRALLEPGTGVTRVRVAGHSLETDSGEIRLPANVARLASFLLAHPCSSWSHLRWGVYPDIHTDDKALESFDAARAELEAVRGVRVVYRAAQHVYSLVWEGVSLER